ncbi:MAG: hypothetical protein COZ69_03915 [Deltaproteobacteria bacterium CG_4_8_14_3_um_filter_45_9]|nr:MAG: hypothetical protein COZ69_03915 [Deltaproteobacteria bacterium CG_4_8_14_3_um_filter_45_9]
MFTFPLAFQEGVINIILKIKSIRIFLLLPLESKGPIRVSKLLVESKNRSPISSFISEKISP